MKRTTAVKAGAVLAAAVLALLLRPCGSGESLDPPGGTPGSGPSAPPEATRAPRSAAGTGAAGRERAVPPPPAPTTATVAGGDAQTAGAGPVRPGPGAAGAGGAANAAAAPPIVRALPPAPTIDVPGTDLRATAVVARAGTGLLGEEGMEPALVELRVSRPAPRDLAFRVTVVPEGSWRLPRDGVVRVPSGRDVGILRGAASVEGAATATFTLLGADGQPTAAQLHVPLVGTPLAAASDPRLRIVAGPPREIGPGNVLGGDTALRGLAGALAGTLCVQRSRFRDFDTRASVVELAVEDPDGIVAGTVPASVVVPAGEGRSSTFAVSFHPRAGRATLRARCGGAETTTSLESIAPAWRAPGPVFLPAGASAEVVFGLEPASRTLEGLTAASERPETVEAAFSDEPRPEYSDAVRLVVRGRLVGDAEVVVGAESRGRSSVRVTVVEPEIVPGADGLSIRAIPVSAKGTIVLAASRPAVWGRGDAEGWPAPVRTVEGFGTPRLTVTVERGPSDPDAVLLDVLLGGTASPTPTFVVEDAVHVPRRIRYRIGSP